MNNHGLVKHWGKFILEDLMVERIEEGMSIRQNKRGRAEQ
jgi:hypothetical protein